MAESNRFFRWLGRANSLLFFLAILGLLIAFFVMFVGEVPHGPPLTAQTKSDKDAKDVYVFTAGLDEPSATMGSTALARLSGTDEGIMLLQRVPDDSESSFSRSRPDASTLNLLSVNLQTLKSRWLFGGVKRDIATIFQVRASVPVPQNASDPVTALLVPVADKDTDGDGRIAASDDHALYLYRLGSSGPVKLLEAKIVMGIQQLDGERLLVLYSDGKIDHACLISAGDFHTIADTVLSTTPK